MSPSSADTQSISGVTLLPDPRGAINLDLQLVIGPTISRLELRSGEGKHAIALGVLGVLLCVGLTVFALFYPQRTQFAMSPALPFVVIGNCVGLVLLCVGFGYGFAKRRAKLAPEPTMPMATVEEGTLRCFDARGRETQCIPVQSLTSVVLARNTVFWNNDEHVFRANRAQTELVQLHAHWQEKDRAQSHVICTVFSSGFPYSTQKATQALANLCGCQFAVVRAGPNGLPSYHDWKNDNNAKPHDELPTQSKPMCSGNPMLQCERVANGTRTRDLRDHNPAL